MSDQKYVPDFADILGRIIGLFAVGFLVSLGVIAAIELWGWLS